RWWKRAEIRHGSNAVRCNVRSSCDLSGISEKPPTSRVRPILGKKRKRRTRVMTRLGLKPSATRAAERQAWMVGRALRVRDGTCVRDERTADFGILAGALPLSNATRKAYRDTARG